MTTDTLFAFGVATLQNHVGCPLPATYPRLDIGQPIHFAAVTLDNATGQIVSITPTHSFKIQ